MERTVNKKAHFEYELLEKFDAGIELFGHEVKTVRAARASLEGAYVIVRGGEAFLVGSSIPPYQSGNIEEGYDPLRPRRLLLTKKELVELANAEAKAGLTIVPISMYNKEGKIKLAIAIARGKKKHDKRETIKKRESKIEMERVIKSKR